ncbi:hypothetical protein [Streptomyces naphthomycinicus]|uniref:hypothetical protein n=1 Tax=Streptomyces naphthomycinicus TaxID=2872625 RepID=UPI001CED3F08|nr:hypothetical protein [Streptomyces sp. TML10]
MTNLSYARRMVEAGRMLTPFRSPTIDIDDFCRAARVQAVGAIDHWLHEEVATEKKVWFEAAGCIDQHFFQGRTTFNEKKLRGRYLEITQRRNKIAHDADLIDGDLKQRRPIDEAEVTDAIDWIERIALAIAHVLDDEGDRPGFGEPAGRLIG